MTICYFNANKIGLAINCFSDANDSPKSEEEVEIDLDYSKFILEQ